MSADVALRGLVKGPLQEVDKAVVALWILGADTKAHSVLELAAALEAAGSPRLNRTRLKSRLTEDRRTVKDGDGFRIAPRRSAEVSKVASEYVGPILPVDDKSAIDSDLFLKAPNYEKAIVHQINVSYSNACYDCAAVMMRRLLETMIIEAFEKSGAISEITGGDGNIMSLTPLLNRLGATKAFTVSRQTKSAGSHLKDVGDWSAHNRRHIARKSDIDEAAKHLRLAASDLLHLAGHA